MRLSIIIPFHRNLAVLDRCLAALTPGRARRRADRRRATAPVDDCRAVAERHGARVLASRAQRPRRGAEPRREVATGDILVFIDADVVVPTETSRTSRILFEQRPTLRPSSACTTTNRRSRTSSRSTRTSSHSFIHQTSVSVAQTFWAGFGAVRRDVFLAVGGFDERFTRPASKTSSSAIACRRRAIR